MAIRVPPPTKYHNTTTARFKRTLAEAFPADMPHMQTRKSFPAKKRSGRWLISALLASLAWALAGCSGAEAQVVPISKSALRKIAAAEKSCAGMTPVWSDETTVECFKSHE